MGAHVPGSCRPSLKRTSKPESGSPAAGTAKSASSMRSYLPKVARRRISTVEIPPAVRRSTGGIHQVIRPLRKMSASAVGPFNELPRLDAEPDRQLLQAVDRQVPLAALDASDVGPVQIAYVCEGILRHALVGPDPPHIRADDVPKGAWMRSFHARSEVAR